MTTYTDMVATGVMNDNTETNTDYLVGTTRLFTSSVSASSTCFINSYILGGQMSSVPVARDSYACVITSISSLNNDACFILFGGYTGSAYLNDLWAYDFNLQGWNQLTTTGTAPSIRAGMSYGLFGVSNNFLVIFGGYNGTTYLTDVHVCNLNTLVWTTITTSGTVPTATAFCACAINGSSLYIAGGTSNYSGNVGNNSSHSLLFNSNTNPTSAAWTTLPTIANAVFGASGTLLNGNFYIFGGRNGGTYYSTVQYYNGSSWTTVTPVSGAPPSLAFAGFVASPGAMELCVFGGYNVGVYQDNFYVFNTSSKTWTQSFGSTLPSTKGNVSLLIYSTSMYMFGGYDGTSYYNDLWVSSNFNNAPSSPITFTIAPPVAGTTVNASSFSINGITITASIRNGYAVLEVTLANTGVVTMTQFDSIIIGTL